MSSSTKDTATRGDHLAYAPKWARGPQVQDLDPKGSPGIVAGDFQRGYVHAPPGGEHLGAVGGSIFRRHPGRINHSWREMDTDSFSQVVPDRQNLRLKTKTL